MFSFQDKLEDKDGKKRIRSRKVLKNRKNSIICCSRVESNKETDYNNISSMSSNSHTPQIRDFADLASSIVSADHYTIKLKELTEEKNQLLNVLDSNAKEIEFLNNIVSRFLDINELMKIKQKSTYNDLAKTWDIPNFIVQQRKTVFPKLNKSQMKDAVQNEIKHRKIVFRPQFGQGLDAALHENADEGFKQQEDIPIFNDEFEARPATSAAKHRQSSLVNRGIEGQNDMRKSPGLRKRML
ncbi:hypothetical protein SteCoe_6580 [Stentor coeruleus]|uniref:Uncharacterized protein n=1 Tax=Stentor coeruleus TaxID=5963 RepID=A0A1R2CPR9_9CILI|nr:hypothetical protein SteCoe_21984 [Stentor coeruleus]OMJ91006.1 hypothetical protein SteCoe_6580 [Stentor coeruleus]